MPAASVSSTIMIFFHDIQGISNGKIFNTLFCSSSHRLLTISNTQHSSPECNWKEVWYIHGLFLGNKTRYDPHYSEVESAATCFSACYVSFIKKKVNKVSFQISNWPCFLIGFCSQRQKLLNKEIGETVEFPEIESVILMCNSPEQILQGLHLSFLNRGPQLEQVYLHFKGQNNSSFLQK